MKPSMFSHPVDMSLAGTRDILTSLVESTYEVVSAENETNAVEEDAVEAVRANEFSDEAVEG